MKIEIKHTKTNKFGFTCPSSCPFRGFTKVNQLGFPEDFICLEELNIINADGISIPGPRCKPGIYDLVPEHITSKIEHALISIIRCHDEHRKTLEDKDLMSAAHLCHDRALAANLFSAIRKWKGEANEEDRDTGKQSISG